ncbi:eCIS core domain-containing protein [Kutzneria sp. CA-103260]|uniref:eCIS core domain-containing protein n=1 Tax=Kutzneria sp. CA-103260 TaxID=2802641 RepID=UPI001BA4E1D1|nr:DUF4157 domain-containing protein [Kutzneria sp. CA-103260]
MREYKIQRCGLGSSCDCDDHDKAAGVQRDIHRITSSGGQPLPQATRRHMEGALAADFSGVRVHTGPDAQQAASALRARAFTSGNSIMFAANTYQPGTHEGDRLLAHELAHVVQQSSGVQLASIDGGATDPLEVAADKAAAAAVKVNSPEQSTSSDLLRQLEIYVAWHYFGGKIPEAIAWPVRCVLRLAVTGGVPFLVVYRLVQVVYDLYRLYQNSVPGDVDAKYKPDAQGRRPFSDLLLETVSLGVFDLVSDCLTPLIAYAALAYMRQLNRPHAAQSLSHYLDGSGADLRYDAEQMMADQKFADAVRSVSRDRQPTPLRLTDHSWAADDWLDTFGEVDFAQVTLLDDSDPTRAKVHVVIADPYQWHADELRSIPLVHTVMENMKMSGAKEFIQRVDQIVEVDLTH